MAWLAVVGGDDDARGRDGDDDGDDVGDGAAE